MPTRVLLIERDPAHHEAVRELVAAESLDWQLADASSLAQARALLAAQKFDIIICSHQLDDGTAFGFFDEAGQVPIILGVGRGEKWAAAQGLRIGFAAYIVMDGAPDYLMALSAHVEAALRRQRHNAERLELALAAADLGLWDVSIETGMGNVNERWASMLGYTASELRLVKGAWLQLAHPEDRPMIEAAMEAQYRGEMNDYEIEFRLLHKDGRWVWIQSRARVVERDADGVPLRMAGSHMDVTQRRKEQEELRRTSELLAQQSEALQITLDSMTQGIATVQPDGRTTIYNRRYLELLDLPESLLATQPTSEDIVRFQIERGDFGPRFELVDEEVRQYVASGGGVAGSPDSYIRRSKDGRILDVKSRQLPRGGMVRTFTDVTEYYEAQEALRASEGRFRSLTELSSDWYWEQDANFRFLQFVGDYQQVGWPSHESYGKTRWEIGALNLTEADWAAHRATLEAQREFRDFEIARVKPDGDIYWMSVSGMPVFDAEGVFSGYRGIGRNITERKKAELMRESLEGQLRESQKMQAIGTLAGGIAHDFNNMLGTILGNVELARQDTGANELVLQSLAEIEKAGRKGRDLVRQILSFSRRQPTARRVVSIMPIVEESVRLLRTTLTAQVSIELSAAAGLPPVLADVTQIEQVLVNLGTNAAYAMKGRPGSIGVRVELAAHELAQAALGKPGAMGLPRRAWVRISVQDNGSGMDDATMARMFEPFFTTKPEGEGTGLGLSVVHGIMQTHEGHIAVHSELGRGSTIELFFPAAQGDAEDSVAAGPADESDLGDGQHVLYIDDEEPLVFLITRMLQRKGYQVSGFTDQMEGLDALRADPQRIDLVVVDFNMPGMSGLDVAREIMAIRPELPVAIASGFITDQLRVEAARLGIHELIFKPNAVEEFCEVVRRLVPPRRH